MSAAVSLVADGTEPTWLPTDETPLLDAAIAYASHGLRVLPVWWLRSDGACACGRPECRPQRAGDKTPAGKHPIGGAWQKKATSDVDAVRDARRGKPHANIGLAMGGPERLVAVDIDGEAGRASLAAIEAGGQRWPVTLTSQSGRADGGEHRIFRVPPHLDLKRLGNRASFKWAGIDTRIDGGQIVAAPSMHASGRRYTWSVRAPIADMPDWLFEALAAAVPAADAPKRAHLAPVGATKHAGEARKRGRYGEAALASACTAIAGAPEGARNGTLNREAFGIAQLVVGGELEDAHARTALVTAAVKAGLPTGEATKTLASAFAAGQREPRTAPEPRQRTPRADAVDPILSAADEILDADAADGPAPIRLGADVHRIVDECSAALLRCADLFCRSGELVRIVRDGAPPPDVTRAPGAPSLRSLPPATLLETLTRVQKFVKLDRRISRWVPGVPNAATLAALAARGAWNGMRPIRALLEAPALRPDGTIIQAPGYDHATGYYLEPSEAFPEVPDRPSKDDAIAARDALLDAVCDFPFATEAHRSAWLAFLLTLFARPAVDGCVPFVAVDATTPGTGKGRLVDATARIATGRDATKTPLPQDDEECRKRITSLLIEGERLAVLDNIADAIALPSLDAALTATVWRDRLLGKNASVSVENLTVWAATGNNLTIGGDLARRTLHIRLESPVEDPENRTGWRHDPLLPWVLAERPRLVRAALTILRAHAVAGRPTGGVKPWGSFEAWSGVVASAVAFVDMPDPQGTREGLSTAADATKLAVRALVDGWARLASGAPEGITAKRAIELLYSPERLRGHAAPDGYDDLREAIETLAPTKPGMAPNHAKLGARLRSIRQRIYGGRVIDGSPDRKGVVRWLVRGAGDAGLAGLVPNPSRESVRGGAGVDAISVGTGGNIPGKPGIPGTLDPDDDGHSFSDLLDGAE